MRPVLAAACLGLAACGATSPFAYDLRDLDQHVYGEQPMFSEEDIAAIRALQPQLPTPFRLGIAPPMGKSLSPWGRPYWMYNADQRDDAVRVSTWDAREVEVIEGWARQFEEQGIVSEVVILPSVLVTADDAGDPQPLLKSMRTAAARHNVDAVLVVNRITGSQSHANPVSFLDITIVGGWIFPGYDVSSRTVVEALLVDTYNGYLYASARGDAQTERGSAAAYVRETVEKAVRETRIEALDALGASLMAQWDPTAPVQASDT